MTPENVGGTYAGKIWKFNKLVRQALPYFCEAAYNRLLAVVEGSIMGIDAQSFSRELPMSRFWRAKGKKALELVENHAKAWATKHELGPFFASTTPSENSLYVSIIPLADSIEFNVSDDGLSVGFRSSNGGPGYHAAVIDMLDDMARTLKLSWNWGASGDQCSDETEYALNRDYLQLQGHMADFLRLLMGFVANSGEANGPVCIPGGFGFDNVGFSCPLGPKSVEWPKIVAGASSEELLVEASTFFPWWAKERGSDFWGAMLLGSLWQNAAWRAPVSDQEKAVIAQIEYAASKLELLTGKLSGEITRTMMELRKATETDNPPTGEGIGYRRRRVYHDIFQGWSITLPGWLIEDSENEDSVVLFYHGDRALHISSYLVNREMHTDALSAGNPAEWLPQLEGAVTEEMNGLIWRKSPPIFNASENSVSQTAYVASLKSTQTRFLMLTLGTDSPEKLEIFDEYLGTIGYREKPPEVDRNSTHSVLLH